MSSSPIDDVLEAARTALLNRRAGIATQVQRIKDAADAYLRAVDHDLATQFAERNGLEFKAGSQVVRAALDLRATVESLPEAILTARAEPAAAATTPAQATPAQATPAPSAPEPVVTPVTQRESVGRVSPLLPNVTAPVVVQREPVREAPVPTRAAPAARTQPEPAHHPGIEVLQRDIKAASFDDMMDDVYRTYMEEFAARARWLQDQCVGNASDEEQVGKLIRKLTAMVGERGLSGVYGLARSHQANWLHLAEKATHRRNQLLNPTPKTTTKAKATETAKVDEDEDDDTDALDLPALRDSASRGPIIVVGGGVRNDKLDKIKKRAGIELEWVAIESEGMRAIETLERRVRDGRVRALIVLQELMGHKHFEPLVTAARQVGMPFAYGGKAGKASLEKALREIDALTAQRTSATAAS